MGPAKHAALQAKGLVEKGAATLLPSHGRHGRLGGSTYFQSLTRRAFEILHNPGNTMLPQVTTLSPKYLKTLHSSSALNVRGFAAASKPVRSILLDKRPNDDAQVRMAADFGQLAGFRVFPDVLDPFEPFAELSVEYGRFRVPNGGFMRPEKTEEAPKVRSSTCSIRFGLEATRWVD